MSFYKLLIVPFSTLLCVTVASAQDSGPPAGYADLELYHSLLEKERADSAYYKRWNELINTPLDTLFRHYAERGFAASVNELTAFDHLLYSSASDEERSELIGRMEQAASRYKSDALMLEAEFKRGAVLIHVVDEDSYAAKIAYMEGIVEKARRRKDPYMKMRAIVEMWHYSFFTGRYARSFVYADRMLRELETTDDGYPFRKWDYLRIGGSHSDFRDYDKAIRYMKMALNDRPADVFMDDSNLKARNGLGLYYQMAGLPDSAAYYYRSILESEDLVHERPVFNASAIASLGLVALENGEHRKASAMLEAGREELVKHQGYSSFIATVDIALGRCYLAAGDMPAVSRKIDMIRSFSQGYRHETYLPYFYSLCSSYQTRAGNHEMATAYLDSALVAAKNVADKYGALSILRAEQEMRDVETQLSRDEIKRQKDRLAYSLSLLVLCLGAITVILWYYRRNRQAYKALAAKAREWAAIGNPVDCGKGGGKRDSNIDSEPPTKEERELMERVREQMEIGHTYRDSGLTLDSLAAKMEVPRGMLSRTVNRLAGKNFNTYINEFRVKEAVRIILSATPKSLSIHELYEQVGFDNRASFYRAFKQSTGLSPGTFRNNSR